jgi:uncharacterized protein YecE (DUF72 family)
MLGQYSSVFKTVEMDSSFYAIPRREVMERIASMVAQDFVFSAKVPKVITHESMLRNRDSDSINLKMFESALEPIRGKLKLIVIQLPPKFDYSHRDDLEAFLRLCSDTGVRTATEFRHASWLEEERMQASFDLLRRNDSSYVAVDEPLLPPLCVKTASPVYVRMHGRGSGLWYDYRYSKDEMTQWADKVRGFVVDGDEVIVVFNNHPHGNAPLNALEFMGLFGEKGQKRGEISDTPGVATLDEFISRK